MKNIHIKINEFGPLKNVEVDFAPFVLLTGESGLGKSYVNYLFYYIMVSFNSIELNQLLKKKINEETKEQKIEYTTSEINLYLNIRVVSFMQRFLGDEILKCDVEFFIGDQEDEPFSFYYTMIKKEEEQGINSLSGERGKEYQISTNYGLNVRIPSIIIKSDGLSSFMSLAIRYWMGYDSFPYLLPPSRGALVGESYSVKAEVSSAMGMYDEFLRQYDRIVTPGKKSDNEQYEDYLKLMSDLIGGTLQTENGRQYLVLNNDNRVSLTAAAASVKEISPLLFAIKNNFDQKSTFCFEEPEAHLHPKMQIKVADLVAAFSNKGNLFHITTHSDYFLNRINQLIKLNDVKEKSEEQFETLCQQLNIPKMSALDRKKIKAYFFKRENGEVKVHLLDISKNGIPLSTFFDTVNNVGNTDDEIDNVLYNLEK